MSTFLFALTNAAQITEDLLPILYGVSLTEADICMRVVRELPFAYVLIIRKP